MQDMKRAEMLTARTLAWYDKNRRDLPWRRTKDPYRIWIAEVMLQQTQVDTVVPYYERFTAAFPTVQSLAQGPLGAVLKVWENLGYYSRARHLHAAARIIVNDLGGEIPRTWEGLIRLPGVGAYTAGAVLSIAFDQRVPAVDGNVKRVVSRLFAVQEPLSRKETLAAISERAKELVPAEKPGIFNQAFMELGATVCTPRAPKCPGCPVRPLCKAHRSGLQETLPVKAKRPPVPHRDMTAGLIRDREGRLLIVQRSGNGLLAGLWKFPGGENPPGQTLEAALRQIVREETGFRVVVKDRIASVDHTYSHFRITLHAFRCTRRSSTPPSQGFARLAWVRPRDLTAYPFSKADRKIMEEALF